MCGIISYPQWFLAWYGTPITRKPGFGARNHTQFDELISFTGFENPQTESSQTYKDLTSPSVIGDISSGSAIDLEDELQYCPNCDRTFNHSYTKRRSTVDLKCQDCHTFFSYQCARCSRQFVQAKQLRFHLKWVCNMEPRFNCEHCDFRAKLRHDLTVHVKFKHSEVLDLPTYQCPKCLRKYKYRKNMRAHERECGNLAWFRSP